MESMHESGIDLNFDQLPSDWDLTKSLPSSWENTLALSAFPTIEAQPVKESPPLSLKQTNMTSRTQMRQHLQKLQTHDEEERNKQMVMNQQLNAPSSLPSEPLNIQSFIPPAAEVPIQILQVRSQLENPTRYHVVKCQQRQVKEYLTGKEMAPVTTRSLPSSNAVAARTATNAFAGGRMVTAINLGSNNAVHFNDPNSPQSAATLESSAATSVASDVDDIWELINSENMTADDSEHSSTVPNLGIFGDVLNLQPMNGKTSSSCPADLPPIKEDLECPISDAQYKALVKDRQKKDTHNMIERRRRFNINDRIKELGDLLPKNNERYYELVRDVKQNKGTILKASVDYIKKLKDEVRRMKNSEERQRQLEQNNRELLLRIRDLEDQLGVPSSETTWRAASINQIMNVLIKQEPDTLPLYKQECDTSPAYDLMEEDYSAINGDPMLSSPPDGSTGSTNLDDTLSHDSMDLLP